MEYSRMVDAQLVMLIFLKGARVSALSFWLHPICVISPQFGLHVFNASAASWPEMEYPGF